MVARAGVSPFGGIAVVAQPQHFHKTQNLEWLPCDPCAGARVVAGWGHGARPQGVGQRLGGDGGWLCGLGAGWQRDAGDWHVDQGRVVTVRDAGSEEFGDLVGGRVLRVLDAVAAAVATMSRPGRSSPGTPAVCSMTPNCLRMPYSALEATTMVSGIL